MAVKVLFCFYPLFVKYNHGIALLSALCKERGIQTDLYMLDKPEKFGAFLASKEFDYVCFSVVTIADYEKSIPFFRVAKLSGHVTLLGGVWASLNRPVSMFIDKVCRGEGETLADFILSGDDSLFEKRLMCPDLNALPIPDYRLFDGIPFDRGLPELKGQKSILYVSSRGCPYRCRFCQTKFQPRHRVRTRVSEDLCEILPQLNPDVIFLGDAQVPYRSDAWKKSWKGLYYPFVAYIRGDISSMDLQWLIDRGMIGCAFGIESGDEEYRNKVLKKDLTDESLWQTVHILQRNAVWYIPFFMYGMPHEPLTVRKKTDDMMKIIGGYPILWKYEELGTWVSVPAQEWQLQGAWPPLDQ